MPGEPRQLPLGVRLRDSSVFASYLVGRNQPVVESLLALRPEAHCLPVWLYGPAASGKTHLLQALCARAGGNQEPAAYFPLDQILETGPEILNGCDRLAWVCVDDVAAVAGRDEWERALFTLYTQLEDSGGRLVVTAASAPAAVDFKLRDLASRFGGGMVLKLQALDEAEQIAALRLRAAQRGLELPDETARYLLARLPRDMQSLCMFLDALDEASLVAQRRLSVPFVSAILKRQEPAG